MNDKKKYFFWDPVTIQTGPWIDLEEVKKRRFNVLKKEKKCSCGGEKTKTTHSDWCDKYE